MADIKYIAFFNDIFFAFEPNKAFIFAGGKGAMLDKIIISNNFGTDEFIEAYIGLQPLQLL